MTSLSNTRQKTCIRLQSFALLGILAMALLQFSTASHLFEHDIADLAGSCEICVQQDRTDDVPVAATYELPTIERYHSPAVTPPVFTFGGTFYAHFARGPPPLI